MSPEISGWVSLARQLASGTSCLGPLSAGITGRLSHTHLALVWIPRLQILALAWHMFYPPRHLLGLSDSSSIVVFS